MTGVCTYIEVFQTKVTTHIQTCVPPSHQPLDTLKKNSKGCCQKKALTACFTKVSNSSQRVPWVPASMASTCGSHRARSRYRLYGRCSKHMLHLGLDDVYCMRACIIRQLSAPVFHHSFWHKSTAIHGLHPTMCLCRLKAHYCIQHLTHQIFIFYGWMWNVLSHILYTATHHSTEQ